jgi:uncharacterized protein YegP (UPF0339 family)
MTKKRRPKITLFKDKKGEWRFNFKAANGKIIASSEGYKTFAGCENGYMAVLEMAKLSAEGGAIQIEKKE